MGKYELVRLDQSMHSLMFAAVSSSFQTQLHSQVCAHTRTEICLSQQCYKAVISKTQPIGNRGYRTGDVCASGCVYVCMCPCHLSLLTGPQTARTNARLDCDINHWDKLF